MWPLSKGGGPGAESAVYIDGQGGSSREIELDCVCLFAGVRAGGHKQWGALQCIRDMVGSDASL